jgi:two-component system response regulator
MVDQDAEILLVEYNANDEMLALHAFKRDNISDRVFVVRDGAEALEYMLRTGAYADRKSANPKVILLDLKVPLVDGIEVLRQIRTDPRTLLVPVVVLTASNEERDIIDTYELGANSYIIKPADFERFREVAEHIAYYWLTLNSQPAFVQESPRESAPQFASS